MNKEFLIVYIFLIMICFGLSGCGGKDAHETENHTVSIPDVYAASEVSSEISEELSDIVSDIVPESGEASETEIEIEYVDYTYAPPQEVLDTHFYCDDIEKKIEWEVILNEDEKDKFDGDYITTADMPEFIVEDMKDYSLKNSHYAQEFSEEYGEPYFGMSYMLYDMNDDGIDDYYS